MKERIKTHLLEYNFKFYSQAVLVLKNLRLQEINAALANGFTGAAYLDGVSLVIEMLECGLALVISMFALHHGNNQFGKLDRTNIFLMFECIVPPTHKKLGSLKMRKEPMTVHVKSLVYLSMYLKKWKTDSFKVSYSKILKMSITKIIKTTDTIYK